MTLQLTGAKTYTTLLIIIFCGEVVYGIFYGEVVYVIFCGEVVYVIFCGEVVYGGSK